MRKHLVILLTTLVLGSSSCVKQQPLAVVPERPDPIKVTITKYDTLYCMDEVNLKLLYERDLTWKTHVILLETLVKEGK